jgi:hypothetical protein
VRRERNAAAGGELRREPIDRGAPMRGNDEEVGGAQVLAPEAIPGK